MTQKTNYFHSTIFLWCFLESVVFVQAGFSTTKIGPQPIWNSTFTDKLRHDILLNYDKFARPAQHYNATTVKFGLTIRHIEFNEFRSTLNVNAWLHLIWSDEKLKWNSSNYGGVKELHLAEHEVWQPDIFLYNSAAASAINQYGGHSHCISYSNGEVLWVPPAQFSVLCNLNLKYWPFDTQECTMKFGSWTYNGNQINLTLYNNLTKPKFELLIENSEWTVIETSVSRNEVFYECCEEPYPDISITLSLSRISPSYRAIIITPIFIIILITLLGFWLPPQAGEKIILNSCILIIIILYLLYFSQKIPAMGNHTPLIVLFYSTCLYVIAFSTIESVIVIWISRTKHSNPLPWSIKQLLTGKFGTLLGLHVYIQQSSLSAHRVTAEEMQNHQVTDFDESNAGDEHSMIRSSHKAISFQKDWVLLAAAVDRLFFCFYSLLFSILSIAYSV